RMGLDFLGILDILYDALLALLPALKSLATAFLEWVTARLKHDTERLKKETGAAAVSGEGYVSDEDLFE
ncbi:MAG: hypothetical protein MJ005_02105, partial [Methanocorpusculum sp.]|nr:hypothetical protein [Methanocorpusculum sp.]